MKEYIVIKDILNIRNRPSDKEDNSFVGQLLKGDTIWLDDAEITGDIPRNGLTNIWRALDNVRLVASDGVMEFTSLSKKELLIKDLRTFWEKSRGSGISIAIMDTGIRFNPPGFTTTIETIFSSDHVPPIDFHGTRMAGILCGSKTNEMVGFAPDVKIMDYKFLNNDETNVNNNIIDALTAIAAKEEVNIINLSVEFDRGFFADFEIIALEELFARILAQGKIIVAATGNNRSDLSASVKFPGTSENVITVGAIRNGKVINFQNGIAMRDFTKNPDCFIEIDEWTLCNNNYSFESSTEINSSEVTAIMTSLISLKMSIAKNLTQEDIKNQIKQSCSFFEKKDYLNVYKLNISNFINL
ncbi:MAG: S8/S53 family peptidase [Bacteroidota bacterium]